MSQPLGSAGGSIAALGGIVSVQLRPDAGSVSVTLGGVFTATLAYEVSGDFGTTWTAATPQASSTPGTQQFNAASLTNFRVRASAFTSGTVNVTIVSSTAVFDADLPTVVAVADLVAQQANVPTTLLYTVPANAGGMYRVSSYTVLTQVAAGTTPSSALPAPTVTWTDVDTNVVISSGNLGGSPTGNTVGLTAIGLTSTSPTSPAMINAKAGTVIQYSTFGYASVGATPMQYAIHIKLEYLGA